MLRKHEEQESNKVPKVYGGPDGNPPTTVAQYVIPDEEIIE